MMIETAVDFEHCTFPGGYSPYETRGDCWFDMRAASNALRFFAKELRHTKGDKAGTPLNLELWQQNLIAATFGWKRRDGTRRYRYVYVEIPRKAGKSTIASGVALLLLYIDGEPGAEIYSVAGEREQAAIVFEMAKQNVVQNPQLDERSKPYRNSIVVQDPRSGVPTGSYKVLSAEAAGKHGYSPSGIIFDELHVQTNDKLWEAMRSGVGARRQPLTFAITTAGFGRESLCWDQHTLACSVRDGILPNETILPVIYGAETTDDWTDHDVWAKAQPNLGISVPVSFYEDECKLAQQSPSYENTFKRLYLNIWTEQKERWLNMEKWDAGNKPLDELRDVPCWAGLDLSTTTDLTAFVLAFPVGANVCLLPFFWIPEETARKAERRDRVPYTLWRDHGHVRVTPGNTVKYDFVRRDINEIGRQFNIQKIAVDRWNATQIIAQLEDDGFQLEKFGQGYASMSGPAKEFESLVLAEQIKHAGHPVLRWNAANAAKMEDAAENIKPAKDRASGRIDGIVAAVMAVGCAFSSPSPNWSLSEIGL